VTTEDTFHKTSTLNLQERYIQDFDSLHLIMSHLKRALCAAKPLGSTLVNASRRYSQQCLHHDLTNYTNSALTLQRQSCLLLRPQALSQALLTSRFYWTLPPRTLSQIDQTYLSSCKRLANTGQQKGNASSHAIQFKDSIITKDRLLLLALGVILVGGMVGYDRTQRASKNNRKLIKKLHAVVKSAEDAVGDEDWNLAMKRYAEARQLVNTVQLSSLNIQRKVILNLVDQLGHLAYQLGHFEEADMYLREAEKLMIESNYAQNEQAFLEIRLMRAITDGQLGRRNEALGGFHICLKVLEENITDIADPNNIERSNLYGLALHEYGTYAKTIGQLDESELAFSKALDVAKVVLGPTHEQTSVVANDLATIYDEKGRYNKAERLAQKAIRIATETSPEKLATYNFNLGSIVLHKGDVSRARRIFRDALTLAEEGGDEDMKTIITSNITKLDVGH